MIITTSFFHCTLNQLHTLSALYIYCNFAVVTRHESGAGSVILLVEKDSRQTGINRDYNGRLARFDINNNNCNKDVPGGGWYIRDVNIEYDRRVDNIWTSCYDEFRYSSDFGSNDTYGTVATRWHRILFIK